MHKSWKFQKISKVPQKESFGSPQILNQAMSFQRTSPKSASESTWMFPKIGGIPPKWMVYNEKPY